MNNLILFLSFFVLLSSYSKAECSGCNHQFDEPMDGESVSCEPILTSSAGCDSGDVQLLQDIIDANGLDEEFSENDVDDGDGEFEPLELGGQKWEDGRLVWLNLWAEDSGFYYYISEIPNSISNLTELTYLDLDANEIEDLPSSFGNLMNLEMLALGYNPITTIPEEIWLLNGLKELFLHSLYPGLTEIPNDIQNLTNLEGLYLHGNQLSGSIPESISNLSKLKNLYAADNELTGSIPEWIGELTNLEGLNLGDNQFSGSIPESIGNLANLIWLELFNNQLSASIPESICNLTNLYSLWLNDNTLGGEIPECIGNLPDLTHLGLYNNQLSVEIPESLGNLNNLQEMYLKGNQLTGSIPESIGNLSNLEHLSLRINQLSSGIPDTLCNLTNLYSLWLGDNPLGGEIPGCIGNLTNLTQLVLYNNQLSGKIPQSIWNLNLEYLLLDSNQLIGEIPDSICDLPIGEWEGEDEWGYDYFTINNNQFCPPWPECIEELIGYQTTSACTNYAPVISSIIDISNDQGGHVYLYFNKSPLDSTITISNVEMYSIERWDTADNFTGAWVNVVSGSAYNQEEYIYQVETLIDSNYAGSGMTAFRVIAKMRAGAFISEPDSGYSVDNIPPHIPQGLTVNLNDENNVYLNWEANGDIDFDYYILHRSENDDLFTEIEEIIVVVSEYIDSEVDADIIYYYRLFAIDVNGNQSGFSEIVSINTSLSAIKNILPRSYALSIHPNPFNPATTISFSIPEFGLTTIIAYDINGRELETLTNEVLSVGNYSINWNASSYPSGVYLIRMESGDFTQTQKVVLVK